MKVCSLLWAIALEEDTRSIVRFEQEWQFLVDFVNAAHAGKQVGANKQGGGSFTDRVLSTAPDLAPTQQSFDEKDDVCLPQIIETGNQLLLPNKDSNMNCNINFINNLYSRKKQWVRRFIVEECLKLKLMLGHVKTTQRIESLNRVIAEDTSPSNSLVATFESLHKRQKLRFLEQRASLISEVTTIPSAICHPIFEDLVLKSTRFISKKIRAEISQINNYFIESRPMTSTEGVFVVSRNFDNQVNHTQNNEKVRNVTEIQFWNKFKLGNRNVTSKLGDNGLLYLECTCPMTRIQGYPCRHVLFIYSVECTFLAAKEKFAPIMTYLNPYWLLHYCLANFQITPKVSVASASNSLKIDQRLSTDESENVKLLEAHETKIHELKVSNSSNELFK